MTLAKERWADPTSNRLRSGRVCSAELCRHYGVPPPGRWIVLFVPLSTSLYGVRFWQQAVVADAAANPAGFVLSNSRAGRIGSR